MKTVAITAVFILTACSSSPEEMQLLKSAHSKIYKETTELSLQEFTAMYENKMLPGQACQEQMKHIKGAEAAASAAVVSGAHR